MRLPRAVTLDFYNTIVRFEPLREEIQAAACAQFGIAVDSQAILRAYRYADNYLSRENGRLPLGRRDQKSVKELWVRYEALLLAHAGVTVDLPTANAIVDVVWARRRGYALFPDVMPMLRAMADKGYKMGLVSNMEGDLDKLAADLGIAAFMSFAVTSEQVGAAKPNPPIFLEAMKRAGVVPGRTVHIGDQPYADIEGAAGVGIKPVLLDRDHVHDDFQGAPVIHSLDEFPALVEGFEAQGQFD